LRWFGRGPHENYIGRNRSSHTGLYTRSVDSTITLYPEINETGQRTDIRWAALTNAAGIGLLAVGSPLMEINAQHHTPAQLTATKYPWDLTRQSDITFRIDLRQMGLGGVDSWGAKVQAAHTNPSKNTYKHSFRLSPITAGNLDLGYLARMGFKNLATSDSVAEYQTPTVSVVPAAFHGSIELVGLGRFAVVDPQNFRSVQILDIAGRKVREVSIVNAKADVSNLAPGLYIVRVLGTARSQSFVTTVTGYPKI
jgi:hypothetical protein